MFVLVTAKRFGLFGQNRCITLCVWFSADAHRTVMHSVELKRTNLQKLRRELEQLEQETETKLSDIDNGNIQVKVLPSFLCCFLAVCVMSFACCLFFCVCCPDLLVFSGVGWG